MSGDAGQDDHDEAEESGPAPRPGLVGFLRDNLRWWLWPMLLVVLLLVALAILNASQTLPFMYRLVERGPAPEGLDPCGGGPAWQIRI